MNDKVIKAVQKTKRLLMFAALTGVLATAGLSANEIISETTVYNLSMHNDSFYGKGNQFLNYELKQTEGVSLDEKETISCLKDYLGHLYQTPIGKEIFEKAPTDLTIQVVPKQGKLLSQTSKDGDAYTISLSEDVFDEKQLIPLLVVKELTSVRSYQIIHQKNDSSRLTQAELDNLKCVSMAMEYASMYESVRELETEDSYKFSQDYSAIGIFPKEYKLYVSEYKDVYKNQYRQTLSEDSILRKISLHARANQVRKILSEMSFVPFEGGPQYRRSEMQDVILDFCDENSYLKQSDFVSAPHALFNSKSDKTR